MNIVVMNGSPKGSQSVTMQYVAYLEKLYDTHTFSYIHAGWQIAKYEKDMDFFDEAMERCRRADIILWAFPLYFLLVSSRYKQFIELIFDRRKEEVFQGKHTAALSTSIHFFDNTAHDYIRGICDDLQMEYVDLYAASMQDLMDKSKRRSLALWFERIENACFHKRSMQKNFAPLNKQRSLLTFSSNLEKIAPGKKVSVICDDSYDNQNLKRMTAAIRSMLPPHDYVDLAAIQMGPCIGCIKCGLDNVCAYDGTFDEYIGMFQKKILPADIIVFALDMRDRYMGYRFQRFLERSFVRTHQPVMEGKQIVVLVSGPISENFAARNTLKSYFDVHNASLVSWISDESGDSEQILSSMREALVCAQSWAEKKVNTPRTFLGIGGMRLFRDEMFQGLNMVFQADHTYYRKHGIYDFPHGKLGMRIASYFGRVVTRIPFVRKKFRGMMIQGMIRPYKKVLNKADGERYLITENRV